MKIINKTTIKFLIFAITCLIYIYIPDLKNFNQDGGNYMYNISALVAGCLSFALGVFIIMKHKQWIDDAPVLLAWQMLVIVYIVDKSIYLYAVMIGSILPDYGSLDDKFSIKSHLFFLAIGWSLGTNCILQRRGK